MSILTAGRSAGKSDNLPLPNSLPWRQGYFAGALHVWRGGDAFDFPVYLPEDMGARQIRDWLLLESAAMPEPADVDLPEGFRYVPSGERVELPEIYGGPLDDDDDDASDEFPHTWAWVRALAKWADGSDDVAPPAWGDPPDLADCGLDLLAESEADEQPENECLIDAVSFETLRTAPYPNPALARAGALSFMGFLASRKICDESDLRPNLYVLCVGSSGIGKDAPRRTNGAILRAAGAGEKLFGDFRSGEGLEDKIFDERFLLSQWDEFGGVLREIASDRTGAKERLVTALLELGTSASEVYVLRITAGAKRRSVNQPALSLFATTTPSEFFGALSERLLTNGLMARIVVVEADRRGEPQKPTKPQPAEWIVERARAWLEFAPGPGNLATENPTPLVFRDTRLAALVRDEIREREQRLWADADRRGSESAKAIWSRFPEHAFRLALVRAASRWRPGDSSPWIRADDLRYGEEIAFQAASRLLKNANELGEPTEFDKRLKRVLGMIQDAGAKGIKHYLALKRSKLSAREFGDVLKTLQERQQVTITTEGATRVYIAE